MAKHEENVNSWCTCVISVKDIIHSRSSSLLFQMYHQIHTW